MLWISQENSSKLDIPSHLFPDALKKVKVHSVNNYTLLLRSIYKIDFITHIHIHKSTHNKITSNSIYPDSARSLNCIFSWILIMRCRDNNFPKFIHFFIYLSLTTVLIFNIKYNDKVSQEREKTQTLYVIVPINL